jgi:general secretion pathway protein D
LKDLLFEVASEAELGLVIGPDLDRRVTAVFPKEAGWGRRLDALAAAGEFHYVVREHVIEVKAGLSEAPLEPVVDEAPIAIAPSPQPDESPPDAIVSIRPLHARAAELAKTLDRALADQGVGAAADPGSNTVLLSGPAPAVANATKLVRDLDVPRRRFLVEAAIVEMLTAARNDLGIQWRIDTDDFGAGVNFPIDAPDDREGEVTIATGGTVSLKARMSALEAEGRARVVARPRVLVIEGTPALIESVRILRIRLPDSTSVVAGGGDDDEIVGGNSGKAVEEFPVGITLRVEPSLLGGGKVALRVTAKSSTLGEPLPPDDIPEELSRLVEADFFVADGETAVLGGLARVARGRSSSGLPVLRDLPFVGALFGRRSRDRDAEELVVLVTPYLLD